MLHVPNSEDKFPASFFQKRFLMQQTWKNFLGLSLFAWTSISTGVTLQGEDSHFKTSFRFILTGQTNKIWQDHRILLASNLHIAVNSYRNRRSNGISRWRGEGGRGFPTTAWQFSSSLSLWTLISHLPQCFQLSVSHIFKPNQFVFRCLSMKWYLYSMYSHSIRHSYQQHISKVKRTH